MGVSPARRVAFNILLQVETEGSFSDRLLHSDRTAFLDERDRALVFELVLGCLRRQGELDHRIAQLASRRPDQLDAEVLIALRLGCYQLKFLNRIPPHAAVSESVEMVRLARKRSAVGLTNAILRRITDADGSTELASTYKSHPVWLEQRWKTHFGKKIAAEFTAKNLETPETYLRLNARFSEAETIKQLRDEGVETKSTEIARCRLVTSGRITQSKCLDRGRVYIQDLSSQMVVPLLDLQPGLSFLDVCAAPGGKAQQAFELLLNSRGQLESAAIASDLHLHRFRAAQKTRKKQFDCVIVDARTQLPFRHSFDRILVDAPCSGTGTLARNPEIKWRLTPKDLSNLQTKQRRILSNALTQLAPGGILVYSTCSVEPEENRQVVDSILAQPELMALDYLDRLPGRDVGDGFFACKIFRQIRKS